MGASDYMVGNAPGGVPYAAPLVGQQLGETIASLPNAYMQGQQNQRELGVMNAFPNGIPLTPQGTPDLTGIMQTMAKAGGGQYVQQLMPFLIHSEMGRQAGQYLSGTDTGGFGLPAGSGTRDSSVATGPGGVTAQSQATPPSAPPQGSNQPPMSSSGMDDGFAPTLTKLAQKATNGRPADQVNSIIKSAAKTLNLDPDAALDARNLTRVNNFLKGIPNQSATQPAPGQQPQQTSQAAPQPGQQSPDPMAQMRQGQPPQPANNKGDAEAYPIGPDPARLKRVDELRTMGQRLSTYAAAIGGVNKPAAEAALAKSKEYFDEANRLFDTVSKGEQIEQQLDADNRKMTPEQKNYNDQTVVKGKINEEQQKILATSRGKDAAGYMKTARQADEARPQIQMALKLTNQPGFNTGTGVGWQDTLSNLRGTLGLGGGATVNQIFDKIRAGGILDQIKAMSGTGPVRVAEMKFIDTMLASRENQPGALRAVLRMQDRLYERSQQIKDILRQTHGVIDDNAEDLITEITRKPLFTKDEMQHPEAMTFPQFDTPQEMASAGLVRGDHFITHDGRIKTVP